MSYKEKRIRSITKIYYSNPKIQKAICDFSRNREVVPSYMMESFGKRPDTLQYPADITNLVNKGATSFHASEELWQDPLQINSDMSPSELSKVRKAWDLLIDIDSPYLDYSKTAALQIIEELEKSGVKNYGIKFSGSKGFHIIVPSSSFPERFKDQNTKNMFPEWPRAISEYLMYRIRSKYNREIAKLNINFKALYERTKLSKEDVIQNICPNCGKSARKGTLVTYKCPRCKTSIERKDPPRTNRKLKCIEDTCPGYFTVIEEKGYYYCEHCKTSSQDKTHNSDKKITYTKEARPARFSKNFEEEIIAEKMASLDLVLVSSRHLFRMPYSLHEKTALSSIVISKEDIEDFVPRDANPLKVKIKEFYPSSIKGEATRLLESALVWKSQQEDQEEATLKKKYTNYEKINVKGVAEILFPKPIKKLLKGLIDGRKRGLFILLTFLKSLNFSPEYINAKVREWNKLNDPPLKEGYVKSQISWHLKQKKQILPPNYKKDNFYKDLKLIEPQAELKYKNPISEVLSKVRRQRKRDA